MEKQISLGSNIQINEDIVSRNLQGEMVLLNLKTNLYCGLDSTGARIWNLISKHKSLCNVLDELMKEYDVPESQCTEDLLNFVCMLKENKLIEI